MRKTPLLRRALTVGIVATAVCALLSLALLVSGTRRAIGEAATPSAAEPVASPNPQTKELLGVFEENQTSQDEFFNDNVSGANPVPAVDLLPGENPALSRRADVPGSGGPVYLWPTREGVCWSTEGVSSCGTDADIQKLGVLPAVTGNRPGLEALTRVAGIAKDGIPEITVVLAAGEFVNAPVTRNAFVVEVKGSPIELRWADADGEHSVRLPSVEPPGGGEIRDGLVQPDP